MSARPALQRYEGVVPVASVQGTLALELTAEGTPVAGAERELEEVPAAGRCRACGRDSELEAFPLRCAGCGGLDLELTAGEELQVDSLVLDEDDALSTIGRKGDGD